MIILLLHQFRLLQRQKFNNGEFPGLSALESKAELITCIVVQTSSTLGSVRLLVCLYHVNLTKDDSFALLRTRAASPVFFLDSYQTKQ